MSGGRCDPKEMARLIAKEMGRLRGEDRTVTDIVCQECGRGFLTIDESSGYPDLPRCNNPMCGVDVARKKKAEEELLVFDARSDLRRVEMRMTESRMIGPVMGACQSITLELVAVLGDGRRFVGRVPMELKEE